MPSAKPTATVDDVLATAVELIEQVRVLVSAVDDLRCEIEWWTRNSVHDYPPCPARLDREVSDARDVPNEDEGADRGGEPAGELSSIGPNSAAGEPREVSLPLALTASGYLREQERRLVAAPVVPWSDAWATEELLDLPMGKAIAVDAELWASVLELRPAHVVGFRDCACEEGEGAPYLLAWRHEQGCFLRELTDAEAREFQRTCLAAQAASAARFMPPPVPSLTQRPLW